MKNILSLLITLIVCSTYAQVGIGTTDPKATLDVVASNQATPANNDGLLIPRVDAFPTTNPGADQDAMFVYLTTTDGTDAPGFYYWNNTTTTWLPFGGSAADEDWFEQGTTTAPNAITDNIFTQGNVGVGNIAPSADLHITGTTVVGVTGGVITLLSEDFESRAVGPVIDAAGAPPYENYANTGTCVTDDDGWRISATEAVTDLGSSCTICVGNMAIIDYGAGTCNQDTTLVLGTFTPTTTALDVSFVYGYDGHRAGDIFSVILYNISAPGSSLTLINVTGNVNQYNTSFTNAPTVIPGNTYEFRVRYVGRDSWGLSMDNILVTETVTPVVGDYSFRLEDGQQQDGHVLTSDVNGNATWKPASTLGLLGNDLTISDGNTVSLNFWNTTGNAGTVATTNFLGTTDATDLTFRTQNIERTRISTKGQIEVLNTGQSVFIGENAGNLLPIATDQFSVFMGYNAGQIHTGGNFNNYNVAIGNESMSQATGGGFNVAVGDRTMEFTESGSSSNVAIGQLSSRFLRTGDDNTAVGQRSLYENQLGHGNTGIGREALVDSYDGDGNTAVGNRSLKKTFRGSYNTAIGEEAGTSNAGSNNTDNSVYIGRRAGFNEKLGNKLYIESSALFTCKTPLIYGEFDNNILRVGGQLQIGSSDDTTSGSIYGFPVVDGTVGQALRTDGAGNVSWGNATSTNWSILGNTSTDPSINFIGTTDARDLIFRTTNVEAMRIGDNRRIGVNAGEQTFAQFFSYSTNAAIDAISGFSAVDGGVGVYGSSQGAFGSGTFGFNNDINGTGVLGINSVTGTGVLGLTQSGGTGVVGASGGVAYSRLTGFNVGISGTSQVGVYGMSLGVINSERYGGYFAYDTDNNLTTTDTDSPIAILAGRSGDGLTSIVNFGGYFSGGADNNFTGPNTNPDTNGSANDGDFAYVGARWGGTNYKIIGSGTVSTIIDGEGEEDHVMFAPEAPEILFQDYGIGKLVNGKAEIKIDAILQKNIIVDAKHPLKVFIQLEGDCNGVFVTNKSQKGFTVNELQGGTSNVSFSYQLVANRVDKKDANGRVLSKNQDVRLPIAPKGMKPLKTEKKRTKPFKEHKLEKK